VKRWISLAGIETFLPTQSRHGSSSGVSVGTRAHLEDASFAVDVFHDLLFGRALMTEAMQ
jgi:hypothetical protein